LDWLFFLLLLGIVALQTTNNPIVILFLDNDMGLMDTSVPMLVDKNRK
jgi:fucose permease